jgi:hypothetical protein
MKKFILYLTMLAVLPLAFMGCSTISGDNPMGTTGGGDGYGVIDPANSYGSGIGELEGTWRHDYNPGEFEMVVVSSNGGFVYTYYYNYSLDDEFYGTCYASGNILYVDVVGNYPLTLPYELSGDYLTLDWGQSGGEVVYHRVY